MTSAPTADQRPQLGKQNNKGGFGHGRCNESVTFFHTRSLQAVRGDRPQKNCRNGRDEKAELDPARRTEIVDDAVLAARDAGDADATTVPDQQMREKAP